MSRRRKEPRDRPGIAKLTVRCVGSTREPHSAQRVGTARVNLLLDAMSVRVEYGGLGEPDSPTGHYRPNDNGPSHMTYRFACRRCGFDLPIQQDKLAAVIIGKASVGESSIVLSELAAIVS